MEKKKRFSFADAKARIKELEAQINVDLTDNIVSESELKVLKIYKTAFFITAAIGLVAIFSLFV